MESDAPLGQRAIAQVEHGDGQSSHTRNLLLSSTRVGQGRLFKSYHKDFHGDQTSAANKRIMSSCRMDHTLQDLGCIK